MPLVTSKKMLDDAQKGHYAVGAFNAENMEMVKAIIAAAEEVKAPVMIQTTPSTIKYGTVETFYAIVAAEAAKASVPVCLHLDHGNSFELAVQAMKAGKIGFLGKLLNKSHKSLSELYEVTGRELDILAYTAQKHPDCAGSRMTGAGFGGCTISLVKTESAKSFEEHVCEHYERATGYKAQGYEADIADGIEVKKI